MSKTIAAERYGADYHDASRLKKIYRVEGFVAARGLFSPDEVATFRTALDEAVAARLRLDPRNFEERTPYEQCLRQCIHLWVDNPAVRPLNFHPKLTELAANLLGVERLRLWHDQALYKEPGDRETDAHQDHAYWPVFEPDMVTAWIPFVDVDETNGCMGYVPRTQHSERQFVNIFTSTTAGEHFAARHAQPQFMPCRAGDVIFHAARTAHMAKSNKSSEVRAVHTVVYFRDGCTRGPGGSQDTPDAIEAKIGEPICGPSTPIAWPLPDGKLPAPPLWGQPSEMHAQLAARGLLPSRAEI